MSMADYLLEELAQGKYPERPVRIAFVTGEEGGSPFNVLRYFGTMGVLSPIVAFSLFYASGFYNLDFLNTPAVHGLAQLALGCVVSRLPFCQIGLIGSGYDIRSRKFDPHETMIAVDIVGRGGITTSRETIGTSPITWLGFLPIRYDSKLIETIREICLIEGGYLSGTMLPLGASDMAYNQRGIFESLRTIIHCNGRGRNAAGIFAVDDIAIDTLHSDKDKLELIEPETLGLAERILRELPAATRGTWHNEEQIIERFDPELIELYQVNGGSDVYAVLRGNYSGENMPPEKINAVYKATIQDNVISIGEFQTWGVSKSEDILRNRLGLKKIRRMKSIEQGIEVYFSEEIHGTGSETGFKHMRYNTGEQDGNRASKTIGRIGNRVLEEAVNRAIYPLVGLVSLEASLITQVNYQIMLYAADALHGHPYLISGAVAGINLLNIYLVMLSTLKTFFITMKELPKLGYVMQNLEDHTENKGMYKLREYC